MSRFCFRVWCNARRRMYESGRTPLMLSGFFQHHAISLAQETAVLMQSTGLRDKNGSEIFEGDIVKWDDQSNGKYWRIADVRWLEGQFGYFDHVSQYMFEHGSFAYADQTEEELEIIGNIYEHPHLIPNAEA